MQIEIPKQVEWILEELRQHGYEAFAVGGCVRDTLLSREPGDWDITTSARPEQVKRVFGRTIDTGLKHGTVTVLRDHVGYEITTYRIDGEYEDGRHPKEVAFTTELREDLRRRDFTINAMAYSHETGIVDEFGGMEDLKNGIVRCVGDARERFTEDALRILRAIRFSAQLDFSVEEKTFQALHEIAPNLAHVSKERIQVELTKTLLSGRPERILMVEQTGMSPYISGHFPEAFSGTEEERRRLSLAAGLPKDRALRWAAFLAGVDEQTAFRILKELKMDNDTINRGKTLVQWFRSELSQEPAGLRRAMSSMEDSLFDLLLEMREALLPERSEEIRSLREAVEAIRSRGDCIRMRDLAVTGNDLIRSGIRPGPGLGRILDTLFSHVLEEPQNNRREWLLDMAGRLAEEELAGRKEKKLSGEKEEGPAGKEENAAEKRGADSWEKKEERKK